MIIKNNKAFTFVELIISSVIIIILMSVWFSSYVENIPVARDTERKTDLINIDVALKSSYQNDKVYPNTWSSSDTFTILNDSLVVATQWKLNENVKISTLSELPYDPDLEIPYTYSVTSNRKEYQLWATLESWETPQSLLKWNYKSVSKDVLPSIILAKNTNINIDISIAENKKTFILDGTKYNLPYDDIGLPYSDSTITDLDFLFSDPNVNYLQNIDYRNCNEIENAWKYIWPGTYQIRTNTWSIVDTTCS